MIDQFVYDIPTRILYGAGSLQKLHEENLPGKKALIAISQGGSMKRHGQLDALMSELDAAGVSYVLFDQIRPNPTAGNVDDAAACAVREGCDFVVALGGGSVMDAAKAIALVATNEGSCWDYAPSVSGGQRTPEAAPLPLVCVTTSAGTGSEVDMWSVISNDETQEKTGYASMYPTLSVADGSDKEARNNMAIANTLAGYYMLCTSEHTMEHALGSAHPELVHGAGLIMISHEYFDFFAQARCCEGQMAKMARAMGVEGATGGADFIAALDKLIADVNCANLKMSDYGITREELPGVVKKYHEVWGGNNEADPARLTDEDVLGMFERSYR